MFRIPDYVLDFNEETGFMQRLQLEKDQYKDAPPRAWSRILAQLFFGSYFGVITKNALCIWWWWDLQFPVLEMLTYSIGVAVGIWAVGCVGHQQVPLLRTLGAAAGSAVVLYMIYHDDDENMPGRWSPFIATMAATYYRSWRTTPSFGR